MKKPNPFYQIKIYLFLTVLFISGCKDTKHAPPFPSLENQYRQPITKSFTFSEPDTIKWTTQAPDRIKPLPIKKFSWDKLPAKAFDIGIPHKIKKPLLSKTLDWNSLPATPFNLDSLPKKDLKIIVKTLGQPNFSKAGYTVSIPKASRGVTGVDFNFGLPGAPHSLLKDKEGMLWFGTTGSIAKYDSEDIATYGSEQGLDIGIVYSLFEDSLGRIWVSNTKNITIIDFQTQLVFELSSNFDLGPIYGIMEAKDGTFWFSNSGYGYNNIDLQQKTIRQFDTDHGLLNAFTITPFQDGDGLLWFSTFQGINILNLKEGKNITLTTENGLLSNSATSFVQDIEGKIWIGNSKGASIINSSKNNISYLTIEHGLDGNSQITDLFQDRSGTLWFGYDNGLLFSYSESSEFLEKFIISNNPSQVVFNIQEDRQGQIWAAVLQGGIYKIDQKNGRPGNFTMLDGLGDNAIWSTLEAKDGKIWIGSYGGIDIYDPKTEKVKHLGIEQGLISLRNSRLMEDSQGRIWASGSNRGVSIIDPQKETIQQLTSTQGLETSIISSIRQVQNDVFWMAGSEGEILKVDLEHSDFKFHLATTAEMVFQNNIIIKDNKGFIWIGGLGSGIQKINPNNNTVYHLTENEGLISNQVFSLTVDAGNNIWAATEKGVVKIDEANQKITTFTATDGLGANDVYAIIEHNGEIYTGTSKGLSILKPTSLSETKKPNWSVRTFGKWQGLNFVDFAENSFTFDKNGRFWAGVDAQMLTVMDPIKVDTITYPTYISAINVMDKKRSFRDVAQIEEKRSAIDTMLLSNKVRLELNTNMKTDSTYLAKNNIHWKTVEGPYNMPIDLTLPHTQNYLSFNYFGMQLSNPDKRVYRYFLEGIDKNWSPISEKTTSENYRDLLPGDYTFKVASKGFNEVWGKPAEIQFTILPPWWQTWWAYLLFALVFGTLVWSMAQYRSRWLKKENRILEEKVSIRTGQLKNKIEELKATQSQLIQSEKMASLGELTAGIAHEIQNPLNFVNNFSEVNTELIDEMQEELKSGNNDEAIAISNDIKENQKKINHHGRRADAIVKGMLQHSRNNTSEKEPTNINALADEYLRLSYHGLRAKDKSFNAKLETDFDKSIGNVNVVAQDIGRVILNLITNAFYACADRKKSAATIKDGSDYEPTVKVTTKSISGPNAKKNGIAILVSDNGSGIPKEVLDKIFHPFFTTKPSGEGTGLGLSLSYDIVKAHGGELKVETKEGEGTIFTINLPNN